MTSIKSYPYMSHFVNTYSTFLNLYFYYSNKVQELQFCSSLDPWGVKLAQHMGAQLRSFGHTGASDMVYRHHSLDFLSTYGTLAVWKGLVAVIAAAHVSAVQQNTVTWLTETNNTGILDVILVPGIVGFGSRRWSAPSTGFSLQPLKFPPLVLSLPANL